MPAEETLAKKLERARVGRVPKFERPTEETGAKVREAAEGTGGETTGKPPELPFNLDRYLALDGDKALSSRLNDALRVELGKAQGKQTLDEIKQGAKNLLGITSQADLQRAAEHGLLGTGESHTAVRIVLRELEKDLKDAQKALKEATGEAHAPAEEKTQAVAIRLSAFKLAAKGAQGDASRALSSYRILVAPRSETEILLSRLLKQKGGISAEDTARILRAAEENPAALPDVVQSILKAKLPNKLLELWKAGLLSGVPTQGANFTGNLLKQGLTLAETAFTAHVTEPLLAKSQGRPVERFSGEAAASWAAVRAKAPAAFQHFLSEMGKVFTLKPETVLGSGNKLEYQVGAIGGKTGRAVRIPFRILTAADGFFKELAGGQELYKQALRRAHSTPRRTGESVTDVAGRFVEHYELLGKEARADQYPEIVKAIEAAELGETFQDRGDDRRYLDATAMGLQQLTRKVPILQLVFPFVKTPSRIASATLERTPLGFLYALKHAKADYQSGKITGGQYAEALTKPILGTAFALMVGAAAKAGLVTGSGPADRDDKNLLLDTGWQPYSFVFTEPSGKLVYVPFNRFEPVSSIMGLATDLVETEDEKKAGDMLGKIGGSILENLTNKNYLSGFTSTSNALSDPKRYAGQFIKQLSGTVVPTIVAKAAQATDPYVRDTKGEGGLAGIPQSIGKTIASRIPGLSRTLPARKGPAGEPLERIGSGISRFLSPSVPSEEKPGKELEKLLVKIRYIPGQPERSMQVGKRTVLLDRDDYETLQGANLAAAQYIRKHYLGSPHFQKLPDTIDEGGDNSKEHLLRAVYEKARRAAKERLVGSRGFRERIKQANP